MSAVTTVPPDNEDFDPVWVEAADWLVRLTSGEATEADAHALASWRAQSAAHDLAFRELAGVPAEGRMLRRQAKATRRRDVLVGAGGLLTAAAASIYGLERPPFGLWPSLAELTADHHTGAGERFAFAPTTGVRFEMNSSTSVSLTNRGRSVRLIQGEAFVAVDAPRQPFTVEIKQARVEAAAARFNIQSLAGDLQVACVEGAMICRQAGQNTVLNAGEALTATGGKTVVRRIDPAATTAWLNGFLVFKGDPLIKVIAQINLYRPGRIILANAAIARRPVTGVFHTNQIENAVGEIQQLVGASLQRLPGGVVLIG